MIPSGTDHGTDPLTPRNRTSIRSDPPCYAFVRRLDAPRELAEQFLRPWRIIGQHVTQVVFGHTTELRVRGRDDRGRTRLVEEQPHLAHPVAGTKARERDPVRRRSAP